MMDRRVTDMVGSEVVVQNPYHLHAQWRGTAVAVSESPSVLVECADGVRRMLPLAWAEQPTSSMASAEADKPQ